MTPTERATAIRRLKARSILAVLLTSAGQLLEAQAFEDLVKLARDADAPVMDVDPGPVGDRVSVVTP